MHNSRLRILLVTDLSYQARGRRYGDEDIFLSARLREDFDLAICHPLDTRALMTAFDVVVIRNSGPVLHYQAEYEAFRAAAAADRTRVYNQLSGKGDMAGKQHLLDLFAAGYPVIPTIESREHAGRLPDAEQYVTKPKFGADSTGLALLDREELGNAGSDGLVIQPLLDFRYEVSFYFVDQTFQYALYAPDPAWRWALERYEPTAADLDFAQRFIDWNDIRHGIQRVDACRARDGELLLVELEDLNPYLSLDRLEPATRDNFVAAMTTSISALAGGPPD
jgi:hypothetical protein